jgi:predicted transposase YbfD/YdcC
LAQEAVDEKSNEIVAILPLGERLQLTGALVTIDAMGTQTDIAGSSPVAARLSPRVEGQPAGPCIRMSLTNPPAPITERGPATNFDHGRIEERRHVVCQKVDWLFSNRPLPRRAAIFRPRGRRRTTSPSLSEKA